MSQITTHVLDAAVGGPARGVGVALTAAGGAEIASGVTDEAGRISDLGPDRLEEGEYRLTFATGKYFARTGRATFYPVVSIDFSVADDGQHYHVPLLLSPFAYSTYRGN
ncbi:hydroxyisourate hydrolase [Microbacterium ureisolvens]|uniref:5-hydroxyisourate hydrolase n=1 Tax=Microbacterium ureisolvens TaxID=2781186 RepID=A0ABS7I3I6_9MICO|nr:hydroxyisourate hydrolase [Microbacterium ureisolvens]MBW9111376.1 hydroxyisourate hydrolase [Microbacterium ureisolvens]